MNIKLSSDSVITIAEGQRTSTHWKNCKYKLSEFFGRLQNFKVVPETAEQYFSWKNSEDKSLRDRADAVKARAGGFVGGELDDTGLRREVHVARRYLLTWDFDSGIPFFLPPGVCSALYSTFSHTKEHPRFRLVIPLSRPVSAEEYKRLSRLYVWDISEYLYTEPERVFTDDSTHGPEHFQYWPSCPSGSEHYFDYQDGSYLDVDRILDTDREPYYPPKKKVVSAVSPKGLRVLEQKIPEGQRYSHLIQRLSEITSKLRDASTPEQNLAMLWQIAHDECEGEIDGEDYAAFCNKYKSAAEKFYSGTVADDYDYKTAVRTYFEVHPGEDLPQRGGAVDWETVRKEADAVRVINQTAGHPQGGDEACGKSSKNPAENPSIKGPTDVKTLFPSDFTDLGQALVFTREYGESLRYSDATRWLVYNGEVWEESTQAARALVHTFLKRQIKAARLLLKKAREQSDRAAERLGPGSAAEDEAAKTAEETAKAYRKKILSYQSSARIDAILKESAPGSLVKVQSLDGNAYLLNTPSGTIDLRTGETRPHDAKDYCTKITSCGGSSKGAEEWAAFLDQVTGSNEELRTYLQVCVGMAAIGEVKQEKLLIPYGSGGNGKSTFWNAIARVMGDYAGNLSAEALTVNSRKNTSPEFAELRGKRLVLAAELEEGNRLDTSILKKLCSTDMIQAEKKYKDPFSFRPSHTVVLFTNHLPKVGTNDRGTWDRLVVIPFRARFRNQAGEVMNYAEVLYKHCGEAILSWIVEGARMFIENGYKLNPPKVVRDAIAEYRADNDWLQHFLDECCTVDQDAREKSGCLSAVYARYCQKAGEYRRSNGDFKAALTDAGFYWRKTMTGAFFYGLKCREGWLDTEENPLVSGDNPF